MQARTIPLLTLLIAVVALYFGRAVLMPLALAGLLAFLLTPLTRRLEQFGFGRIVAVVTVTLMLGGLVAGIGWVGTREARSLSSEVRTYRSNLRAKAAELRAPLGSLSGAAQEIEKLEEQIEERSGAAAPKVEVVESQSPLAMLGLVVSPFIGPLGTAGIVLVLALFMLLGREELRDRLIWLTGSRDLSVTTRALDDAGQRVSRYLAAQSLVAAIHGTAVGVGLLAIGLPGAVLWGVLAALLRFLPYFGPWIAASLPITLALAAFPGWSEPLLVVGLLIGLELLTNNVLEPWLFGASAGLSPFGVVLSALFWTWIWGIPGLLLSTPLSVCLVVGGRYVRQLSVFSVLLGDQPALSPEIRLYQRLLADDPDEAAVVLRDTAAERFEELLDGIVFPVLRRLAEDDLRDALPDPKTAEMRAQLEVLIDEAAKRFVPVPSGGERPRVLLVPALDESDALAGRCVARLAELRGLDPDSLSPLSLASEVVERALRDDPAAVCISALTARAAAHARLPCRRLAALGDRRVVVGLWAAPPHEVGEHPRQPGEALRIATARELVAIFDNLRALRDAERQQQSAVGAGPAQKPI